MINFSLFRKSNFLDTCSIWNILSSKKLLYAAQQAGCEFYLTTYVLYECLYKTRNNPNPIDSELQERLKKLIQNKGIKNYSLTLEDLQDVEILENRKRLGKGELSSIVLARRYSQGLLTDDQKARKLALIMLNRDRIHTTPHLLGWLFYEFYLSDSDIKPIIEEHKYFNGILEKYFMEVYKYSFAHRLVAVSKEPETKKCNNGS